MYIIIIGCGRFGRLLVSAVFNRHPHCEVCVIDREKEAVDKIPGSFGCATVVGDASEITLLEKANIQKADYLMAVTEDDNLNFMISHIAREYYQVPRVLARITDCSKVRFPESMGITVINPFNITIRNLMADEWL